MSVGETRFPPRAPSCRSLRSRGLHGILAGTAGQDVLPPVGARHASPIRAGLVRPASFPTLTVRRQERT